MSVLTDLLGEKIQGKDGDKNVEELLGEENIVALYFSAHWCPPCRAFTPTLARWYNNFKKTDNGSKLDIVFVSSDRDQAGFDEYYQDMPWLALPYSEREKKANLSRKFKVTGIPTLIMLNSQTGKVITADGRSIVTEDPEGKEFPWTPQGFFDIIRNGSLITGTGTDSKEIQWEDVKGTSVGLYFSAHWCGPCRSFTPQLIETYKTINEETKKFEIIFISSDKDEEAFTEYYGEMPWLAIKLGDDRKKNLSRIFDVSGIPTLVILDMTTGAVITSNGRGAVEGDPTGQQFPWYPKPVEELKGFTAAVINEQPALVWLTDDSEEESKKACEIMTPIAKEYLEETKDLDPDEKLAFLYSGPNTEQDDVGNSLRGFLKLPEKGQILFATNIPSQEKYICEEKDITADVIQRLVKEFKTKTLAWSPIQ